MAATGALLLLVAAGIFLAVSWDLLGLTARVAIVGSVTAAAIVGGHLLRRSVPAVGTVLFHLGALLLPVDAIGLALQLDLQVGAAWLQAGLATLVALPALALAGRSRLLAGAAVVGVPMVATGLGLLAGVDPALVVAAASVLAVSVLWLPETDVVRVWRGAPVALAVTAVHLPLVVEVLDLAEVRGELVGHLAAAGWPPEVWFGPLLVGALAVAATTVCAHRARSSAIAVMVPVLAGVSAIVAVLPAGTPRLALLLVLPVTALLLQVLALLVPRELSWAQPLAWAAGATELLGAALLLQVIALTVEPEVVTGTGTDLEVAAALSVGALAWLVAAVRRRPTGPQPDHGLPLLLPVLLAAATLSIAGAVAVALPGQRAVLAAVLLLVAAGAATLRTVGVATPEGAGPRDAPVAGAVAVALVLIACWTAWSSPLALPVALLAGPLVALHVRGLLELRSTVAVGVAVSALPLGVVASPLLAFSPRADSAAVWSASWLEPVALAPLVAVSALLVAAALLERAGAVSDLVRAGAGVVGFAAVGVGSLPAGLMDAAQGTGQTAALTLLRPAPSMLPALVLVVVWLLVDAVRRGRIGPAVIVAPLVVRLAAVVTATAGGAPGTIGVVLLVVAVVAGTAAVAGPIRLVVPLTTAAVFAGLPGWTLLAASPQLRAWSLVGVGLLLVGAGVVRRRMLVGYLGGVVATIGTWQLLALYALHGLDLWVLPVAAMLTAVGSEARRRGSVSSWAIDVPPLLLVVVPALVERAAGGPGYHAVLAGGLAIVAVVYGGARGRGGPLVSGSLAVLAVVVIETIGFASIVPTWAWFAVAGVVLIAAAVLIERAGGDAGDAVARMRDLAGDDHDEAVHTDV